MTLDEGKKVIEQLKAQGNSEEAILGAFYKMFQNEELTFDELDGMVNLMGYHITDEFKNMSPEDQKTKGYEETEEPAEGVDKEEIEDAKEAEKGEPEEKPAPAGDEKSESDEKSDDKEEEKDEDEDKAMELFFGKK